MQKEKAEDSYKDELVELIEKENLEQRAEEFERNQEEKMRDVKAANLLNVDKMLVDMLKDDTEQSKLQLLPFYNKHLEEYVNAQAIYTKRNAFAPAQSYLALCVHV